MPPAPINPDWLDTVVVDETVAGRPVSRPLTPAEMAAVARALMARDWTLDRVCRSLRTRHDRLRQLMVDYPGRKARR